MIIFRRASFLFIMIMVVVGQLSVTRAAVVDLPDTNRITLSINPNAVVRVYETNDTNYYQYINERFAFTIKIPSSFSTAMQAGNNGSACFGTPDKQAELSAWGSHNFSRQTLIQAYQERIQQLGSDSIAYQSYGGDWYVLSWVKDGKIYYEKEFVSYEYLNVFTLSYPREMSEQFNDITATIEQSFIPGWKSGRKIWG